MPRICKSTSAFKNAVDRDLRAEFHAVKSFAIRSDVRFVPFDFNAICGTGSFAYISAALSNAAAALIVLPARDSTPSSNP